MLQPLKSAESSGATDERFKRLAEKYCAHLSREGISRRPYADANVPLFSKADSATRARAIEFLEMAILVFESTIQDGRSLRDSRHLIWRTLSHHRLVPDSKIFEHVTDDRIIELFELDPPNHIAWNVKLMEFVSFTIEQLLTVPLWELGSRPPKIEKLALKIVGDMASGETNGTVLNGLPTHPFQELNSEENLTFEITLVAHTPLRRDGRCVGFLSVNECRVIAAK